MDKIKTLSAAIRYGSTFIGETSLWTWRQSDRGRYNCGCALGTAYLAVIDDTHLATGHEIIPALMQRFNVDAETLFAVSNAHCLGRKTRAQCADWLEQQGY